MSSALQNLTPEERDERVLMILRAAGKADGLVLHDAYGEGFIRAALKTSLIPQGLAEVRGKPSEARAFITPKGLKKSVEAGEAAAAAGSCAQTYLLPIEAVLG